MADLSDLPVPAVTPQDLRMFLIDRNPGDNFLLDAVEFDNAQVASALRLCVDKYQSTPPILCPSYGVDDFPHRYELILGAAAILLKMMAVNLTRNRLNYQTREGTAIDDKAGTREYLDIAREMSAEFDARIKALKIAQNLQEAYGHIGSPFARGRWN
jgi:hypothetical protein